MRQKNSFQQQNICRMVPRNKPIEKDDAKSIIQVNEKGIFVHF